LAHQLRNSRHRSVSGFAENCTMAGISSLSAATRFAGLAAEGDGELILAACAGWKKTGAACLFRFDRRVILEYWRRVADWWGEWE
ncbi:hypothetical protein AALC17_07805, partial [Oscillospiraceae bacterium 38-13]